MSQKALRSAPFATFPRAGTIRNLPPDQAVEHGNDAAEITALADFRIAVARKHFAEVKQIGHVKMRERIRVAIGATGE
jgi:hypothetical protein